MSPTAPDPGSFRDPGGRVFLDFDRVLRAVYPSSASDYEAFRDSGLLKDLTARKKLISSAEIDPESHPAGPGASYLLDHPRIPFLSYPYEWPFALHKAAAILQLDIMLEALERGLTLSDATAYNIQFLGSQPTFIDHLSFKRYEEGSIWAGHRQFCMQFLNPLIMWARLGIAPNSWFRGSLEGIAPEELAPLIRKRQLLSWTIFSHVVLHGLTQRRAGSGKVAAAGSPTLSRTAFKATLAGLRSFIAGLALPKQQTVWDSYAGNNSYRADEASRKASFVRGMVSKVRPNLLFDLGCNSGDYALAAIDAGAGYVVGFDFDFGALGQAVERSVSRRLPFLPLWLDATNPSPSQGWNQSERPGFAERARGDAVLALAFIHHLAIARNIPLDMAVEWIMAIAPVGILEFPPKSDPMVRQLLSQRQDIFPDYDEDKFVSAVSNRARLVATEKLAPGGRLLIWYERKP